MAEADQSTATTAGHLQRQLEKQRRGINSNRGMVGFLEEVPPTLSLETKKNKAQEDVGGRRQG